MKSPRVWPGISSRRTCPTRRGIICDERASRLPNNSPSPKRSTSSPAPWYSPRRMARTNASPWCWVASKPTIVWASVRCRPPDAVELERLAVALAEPGKRAEAAYQSATCEEAKHNYAARLRPAKLPSPGRKKAGRCREGSRERGCYGRRSLDRSGRLPGRLRAGRAGLPHRRRPRTRPVCGPTGCAGWAKMNRHLANETMPADHFEQALATLSRPGRPPR